MTATIADVLEVRARWTVIEGDCLAILPTLPPKSVAHVITDPPYSEAVHTRQWVFAALTAHGAPRVSSRHAGIDFDAITPEIRAALSELSGALAGRWMLAFCDVESVGAWKDAVEGAGLDYVRACIWDKVDSSPQFTGDRPASSAEAIICAHAKGRKRWNGGGRRNVFRVAVNASEPGDKEHPTQKPLALMLELVELFTDPGDVVLDPFTGSGTTGVACLRLGRRFIGIEKDARYAALAQERLSAESQGLTLRDARAGQLSLLEG